MLAIKEGCNSTEQNLCADLMVRTEPWITLQRKHADVIKVLSDDLYRVFIATYNDEFAGFAILQTKGSLVGYVKSIVLTEKFRGQSLGSEFLIYLENEIFKIHPNVFLFVSSFNKKAQHFYNKMGYTVIGTMKDAMVRGYDEILLRKTIGPMSEFRK